jgi:hypothetical protein
MNERTLRLRFFLEVGCAVAGLLLAAVTIAWNDWIEIVFHIDPDAGNGSLELGVCLALVLIAAVSWWLARIEWQRFRALKVASSRRAA